jgi:hypothetical protein
VRTITGSRSVLVGTVVAGRRARYGPEFSLPGDVENEWPAPSSG